MWIENLRLPLWKKLDVESQKIGISLHHFQAQYRIPYIVAVKIKTNLINTYIIR